MYPQYPITNSCHHTQQINPWLRTCFKWVQDRPSYKSCIGAVRQRIFPPAGGERQKGLKIRSDATIFLPWWWSYLSQTRIHSWTSGIPAKKTQGSGKSWRQRMHSEIALVWHHICNTRKVSNIFQNTPSHFAVEKNYGTLKLFPLYRLSTSQRAPLLIWN